MFPAEIFESVSDSAGCEVDAIRVRESDGPAIDSLEPLMLSDSDLDIDEILKAEPNNNTEDLFSDLLLDLP
jgi:hypothetical protein